MCNMTQLTTKTATTTQACVFFVPLTSASRRSPATVPVSSVVVAHPPAPHWQPPRPVGQPPRLVGRLCCSPSLLWLTTTSPSKRHPASAHSAMVFAAVPELAALGQLHHSHRMGWCLQLRLRVPAAAVPETAGSLDLCLQLPVSVSHCP